MNLVVNNIYAKITDKTHTILAVEWEEIITSLSDLKCLIEIINCEEHLTQKTQYLIRWQENKFNVLGKLHNKATNACTYGLFYKTDMSFAAICEDMAHKAVPTHANEANEANGAKGKVHITINPSL